MQEKALARDVRLCTPSEYTIDRKSSRRIAEESTGRGNVCACVRPGRVFSMFLVIRAH